MRTLIMKVAPIVLLVFISLTGFSQGHMDLIDYLENVQLNAEQQAYFNSDHEINNYYDYDIATINTDLFDHDQIQIRLYNYYFDFVKEERNTGKNLGRKVWIGRMPGTNDFAHFVINNDMVTGHVEIDDMVFTIQPLTGRLHIVGEVNLKNMERCQTEDSRDPDESYNGRPKFDPLEYSSMDERAAMQNMNSDSRATGECNIRVLVVYTPAIDAAYADILSQAILRLEIANTGATNSSLNFNWELAACKEVQYVEDTFNAFEHRNKLIDKNDGEMDDVHTWRNLWAADQVALLFVGGGGATRISLDEDKALSTTGSFNFNGHTFHHELAHNFMCTHDLINTIEPGTAPYAGYGEPTTGCFRTIMAYDAACGGVGSCGRDNVYSDNQGTWNCNGNNYPKGTSNNRNTDILNINKSIIVDHRIVPNSITYSGNYDWNNKEAIHWAANNEIAYNGISTNRFELHNGSQGSFRASNGITLGNGFWAKSGSDFIAYRESCTPIASPQPDDIIAMNKNNEMRHYEDFEIQVYPNPFSSSVTMEYYLQQDSYVSINLFDAAGKKVERIIHESFQLAGLQTITYDGSRLSAGNYIAKIKIDDEVRSQKLTLVK